MKRKPAKRTTLRVVKMPSDKDQRIERCRHILAHWMNDARADGLVSVVLFGEKADGTWQLGHMGMKDPLRVLGAMDVMRKLVIEVE